ncbi:hypothetical protein [Planctopirus hydrillae]|uniref:Uncharacterized protein n=1 Tax=Planctopirus hydrillae TaxID=1841610 RepID=A0A1C3EN10_9PLAN|nr:hypothetical protein [Planctopirus hydrillae]ODA34615.1 hypothetical protein A6X21_02730 [Planctopirus hydrillae]
MPQNVAQDMQKRLGSKGPENANSDMIRQSKINQNDYIQFSEGDRKVPDENFENLISELSFLLIGICGSELISEIAESFLCIPDKLFRFVWISTVTLKYTDIIGIVTCKTAPLYGVSTNFRKISYVSQNQTPSERSRGS